MLSLHFPYTWYSTCSSSLNKGSPLGEQATRKLTVRCDSSTIKAQTAENASPCCTIRQCIIICTHYKNLLSFLTKFSQIKWIFCWVHKIEVFPLRTASYTWHPYRLSPNTYHILCTEYSCRVVWKDRVYIILLHTRLLYISLYLLI